MARLVQSVILLRCPEVWWTWLATIATTLCCLLHLRPPSTVHHRRPQQGLHVHRVANARPVVIFFRVIAIFAGHPVLLFRLFLFASVICVVKLLLNVEHGRNWFSEQKEVKGKGQISRRVFRYSLIWSASDRLSGDMTGRFQDIWGCPFEISPQRWPKGVYNDMYYLINVTIINVGVKERINQEMVF